jgi:retron-type reverse transcriptase
VALHHTLPIYKAAYDLLDLSIDLIRNMPRDRQAGDRSEAPRRMPGNHGSDLPGQRRPRQETAPGRAARAPAGGRATDQGVARQTADFDATVGPARSNSPNPSESKPMAGERTPRQQRLFPDRHGGQDRAIFNLVAPLGGEDPPTDMRAADTTGQLDLFAGGSGAVSPPIGPGLRQGDVDRATHGSTPRIRPTPGCRTSTTATRTTTTRTTTIGHAPSADGSAAEFSFTELAQAYFDCRRTKRNSTTALAFEQDLERNLCRLHDELREGTYRPGGSICFVITRPKPREVWAADFRDRIVHHLLYNRIGARFESAFIADSCACIPGRGTLYAVRSLEHKVRSITQNWARPASYLKCDIANFFVSIDKRILRELLARRIHEPWWLRLTDAILFHDPRIDFALHSPMRMHLVPAHKSLLNQPPHLGLPIGNLSSQFFANVYLDELDQFVKHKLRARHYVRYVDDFVLLDESPQQLNEAAGPHTDGEHSPEQAIASWNERAKVPA